MSTTLRSKIRALRRPIANTSLFFVPYQSLSAVLTPDVVSASLHSADVSPLHVSSLTTRIVASGCRLFAILVCLKGEEAQIVHFIKQDQLAPTSLDARLPFGLEDLSTIVPDLAAELFEAQWEFCAPVFSKGVLHRDLHDLVRVPFVSEE